MKCGTLVKGTTIALGRTLSMQDKRVRFTNETRKSQTFILLCLWHPGVRLPSVLVLGGEVEHCEHNACKRKPSDQSTANTEKNIHQKTPKCTNTSSCTNRLSRRRGEGAERARRGRGEGVERARIRIRSNLAAQPTYIERYSRKRNWDDKLEVKVLTENLARAQGPLSQLSADFWRTSSLASGQQMRPNLGRNH